VRVSFVTWPWPSTQNSCSTVRPANSAERYAHHDTFFFVCLSQKKKVAVLIAVKIDSKTFVKTFPQCGFLNYDPNMCRENGALNSYASGVSQRKVIRERRSDSKNQNYFAETNKNIFCHGDRKLSALDAHHQRFAASYFFREMKFWL
jgi:hypothetical protein